MSDKDLRPLFHITGGNGWINDPNGLIYYRGRYHVFFQYNPNDIKWGNICWGHVVSDDLTHWEKLPIALVPDKDYDKDGCFSGSAIEWDNRLWLIYTGYTVNNGGQTSRQIQCLASSTDGINFEKHGVVIGSDGLPAEYMPCDFRDPKIFLHCGRLYCVIAARKADGRGHILLYRSDDMFKWEFIGDLFGRDCSGSMIECPDYRKEGILLYSELGQQTENGFKDDCHTVRMCTGTLDLMTGRFDASGESLCDYGFDFYAPQTFSGANILIGWMSMWRRSVLNERYGFCGMLTVPRKIYIENGSILQEPIVSAAEIVRTEVKNSFTDRAKIGVIDIDLKNPEKFILSLRKKENITTDFILDGSEWILDKRRSGEVFPDNGKETDSGAVVRRMPSDSSENIRIAVVMDEFSIEIFVNGKSLTSTLFTDEDADGIELVVKADSCIYTRSEIV